MDRILVEDIRNLIDKINKLDSNGIWTYDFFSTHGGYYLDRNQENPVSWTNARISPKETYAFLNAVLYTLQK